MTKNIKLVAIDAGFGYTKFFHNNTQGAFPSILGTHDVIKYQSTLNSNNSLQIIKPLNGPSYFYGQTAQTQSRTTWAPQNRHRLENIKLLMLAALDSLGVSGEINVVTGLPINWYNEDKGQLELALTNTHRFNNKTVTVNRVFTIPQPYGTYFLRCLDESGKPNNQQLIEKVIAIVDIGMNTTDIATTKDFDTINPLSGGITVGCSKVYSACQEIINQTFNLDLPLHLVEQAISELKINVYGQTHTIDTLVFPIIKAVGQTILTKLTELWPNDGRTIDQILITGGGADLLGPQIEAAYPHAQIVINGSMANCLGFYRYGLHMMGGNND